MHVHTVGPGARRRGAVMYEHAGEMVKINDGPARRNGNHVRKSSSGRTKWLLLLIYCAIRLVPNGDSLNFCHDILDDVSRPSMSRGARCMLDLALCSLGCGFFSSFLSMPMRGVLSG